MAINDHPSTHPFAMLLAVVAFGCAAPSRTVPPLAPLAFSEFVLVPPGSFVMGNETDDDALRPAPAHVVHITRGFYIGRHEVTQALWISVMGENPSWFTACGLDCPVERVNWHEIQEFIRRLSAATGDVYRLPTEAEWEYACRAGDTSEYSTGDSLDADDANILGEVTDAGAAEARARGTMTVGSFPPNAWGLYDMHGNVWEWTADDYCAYPDTARTDPFAACASGLKNLRGGSFYFSARNARCSQRFVHEPQDRGFSIGFRLVRETRTEEH